MSTPNIGVFLLDDNNGDLELIKQALDQHGVSNYILFNDPALFIEAVKVHHYPVCVIDHYINHVTYGFDVMNAILEESISYDPYIIILSGNADIRDIKDYVNAGARKIVIKGDPGYMDELVKFIKQGIRRFEKLFVILKKEIMSL